MSNLKCCPDPCEITEGCINPLVYLMQRVMSIVSDGANTIVGAMTEVLTNGIVINNNSEFCCPDCVDPAGFYTLGGFNAFKAVIQEKGMDVLNPLNDPLVVYPCCINKSYSTSQLVWETALFVDGALDKTPACCATGFAPVVNRLLSETSIEGYMGETAIVEASSFNGVSGITIILDYLNSLPTAVTKQEKTDLFELILVIGIYIKCEGCNIHIRRANLLA